MSVMISDSASLGRFLDRLRQPLVEMLAVGKAGQRIGQALGADHREVFLELGDLFLRSVEPLFERLVILLHLVGGRHQALDDGAQPVAVLGVDQLVGDAVRALAVIARGARRGVDHRHNLVDFVHHPDADIVDLLAEPARRNVALIDVLEIGVGERAVLREQLVDGLVERRIVAGRIGVPDLVVARGRGLPQRLDLAKSNFSERQGALVFAAGIRHRPSTRSSLRWGR
jgi:hypothetical protein